MEKENIASAEPDREEKRQKTSAPEMDAGTDGKILRQSIRQESAAKEKNARAEIQSPPGLGHPPAVAEDERNVDDDVLQGPAQTLPVPVAGKANKVSTQNAAVADALLPIPKSRGKPSLNTSVILL